MPNYMHARQHHQLSGSLLDQGSTTHTAFATVRFACPKGLTELTDLHDLKSLAKDLTAHVHDMLVCQEMMGCMTCQRIKK